MNKDYAYMAGWLIGGIKTALNYMELSEVVRSHFERTLKEAEIVSRTKEEHERWNGQS